MGGPGLPLAGGGAGRKRASIGRRLSPSGAGKRPRAGLERKEKQSQLDTVLALQGLPVKADFALTSAGVLAGSGLRPELWSGQEVGGQPL